MMRTSRKIFLVALLGVIIPACSGIIFRLVWKGKKPQPEYQTLSEINRYAKTLPEFPAPEDQDFEDPHFEQFYQQRNPDPLELTLQFLWLWQPPPFSPKYFATMIKKITQLNHNMGLKNGKVSFVHIKAHRPVQVYVFGDVHSAFHSLIRDLEHIKQIGVIDDDLKIIKPDTYFVFNGDFIDRSPYNIDSLILLCLFIEKNPRQVIYLAGKHERNEHWLDYGLKRELVARGKFFSKQNVPFLEQVAEFFASLPEAVYITGKNDEYESIRLSFNNRTHLSYDEHVLDPAFIHQKEDVAIHKFVKRQKHERAFDVRAVIKTEDWRRENRIYQGLGQLNQNEGATNWAVLSSPIMVHRKFLNFYSDAFAIVSVDKTSVSASLELVHQDTRTMDGFKNNMPINIVSSRPAYLPVLGSIKVASSMSLIRGTPSVGKQLTAGLNTSVNNYNRTKAKGKSNIRVYVENDDAVPKIARENVLQQLEQGIRFFLLPSGISIFSYLELIKKNRAVVFFPSNGSAVLRHEDYPYIVHFRSTYADEARALIRTLRNDFGSAKFAIFYQDDAAGRDPFFAALNELKRMGITNVLALPYTRGSVSFHTQAEQIIQFSPDALGFFSTSISAKELITQVGIGSLVTPQLFGLSLIGGIPLRRFIKRKGLSLLIGSPVPNPKTSDLPIADRYRKAMDDANSDYTGFSFEAYIATNIFLTALESLKNPVPSPQEVLKVIEAMKNYDFYGLKLNFNPKTRSLAKHVWIENGENTEWKQYPIEDQ